MTTLTDAVYWASKSLAIKAMVAAIKVAQSGKSAWTANAIALAAAQQLALAGHVDQADLVDVPIMVWGWDPLLTMQTRISYGYTWVPSALAAPIEIAPGLIVPESRVTPLRNRKRATSKFPSTRRTIPSTSKHQKRRMR